MRQNKILIVGSIAYDYLMTYEGFFKKTILPEELDNLSVSFQAASHKRFLGGCAPNIAYNLALLKLSPQICGRAGVDFGDYEKWLLSFGISCEYVEIDKHLFSASAYILTDQDDNQICFFAPAAMSGGNISNHLDKVHWHDFNLVCIAPDLPARMLYAAEKCVETETPFIFDPGQALTNIPKESLVYLMNNCRGTIVNEYEGDLLSKLLQVDFAELVKIPQFFVRTLSEKGSEVFFDDHNLPVKAVKVDRVKDVTGSGDAFRAGFIYGLIMKFPYDVCLALGNTSASFSLEEYGTQNHCYDLAQFEDRFKNNFEFPQFSF